MEVLCDPPAPFTNISK